MAEKTIYVFSTLSSGVDYTTYVQNDPKSPVVVEEVVSIAGGANVVAKGVGLITPRGVATQINEKQLEALRQNQVFQMHEKNGYMTISNRKEDPEIVAADMTTRDESSPLVPADFEAEGMIVPNEPGENIQLADSPRKNSRKA